jgi:excisionase family DNA binding protein
MQSGWLKIVKAAEYIDVSPRTLRTLLKEGRLRFSRLRSGTVLIRVADIDDYLTGLEVKGRTEIDQIVDNVMRSIPR